MNAIQVLLNPRSVAVIGASADVAKTAGKPVHFLIKHGFKGQIYPVNPRVGMIAGLPCFADVQALPAAPDVGLVLLGSDRAVGAVAAVELFKDTAIRLLPPNGVVTGADALAMARELKSWPLLDGYRGRPKKDVAALVRAMVAFSRMAASLGDQLIEAEINPVFVRNEGQGVCAADGVVLLAST